MCVRASVCSYIFWVWFLLLGWLVCVRVFVVCIRFSVISSMLSSCCGFFGFSVLSMFIMCGVCSGVVARFLAAFCLVCRFLFCSSCVSVLGLQLGFLAVCSVMTGWFVWASFCKVFAVVVGFLATASFTAIVVSSASLSKVWGGQFRFCATKERISQSLWFASCVSRLVGQCGFVAIARSMSSMFLLSIVW